ncbi:MAG: CCA tRNA nucleotidyltransferase [Candidatus Omnitrophica bacterium]|nr:CCA tRNA nucleotidyltransferase [Candidatus Omnitrophota bacterium]
MAVNNIDIKRCLNRLPQQLKELIHLASNLASRKNMAVYLVGGFVRDLILGVKNFDLDIVVEGDGIKFAERLSDILKAKLICHHRFGTATVTLDNNFKVDIATARKEVYPKPATLPLVTPGSLKDDLFRRDFTINAMAISINKNNFGKLIDFYDGKKDLFERKIRILHNLSFIDDPLRMLRGIRFEKRYHFTIEPNTLRCLKEAAGKRMLLKVQPHRIRDELILILKEEHPLELLRRIQKLLTLEFIHPYLHISRDDYNLFKEIERQISWFKHTYPHFKQLDRWLIYFIGVVDDLALKTVKSICRKFAFSRSDTQRILSYKTIALRHIRRLKNSRLEPYVLYNFFKPLSYEIILMIKARYRHKNIQKHIRSFLDNYSGMRLYINGDALLKLGIPPGPLYKKIFREVFKAKLSGLISSKKEELTLVKNLIVKIGLKDKIKL